MIIYSKPLIGPNFYIASVEDLIGNFDSPEPGSVLIIIKEKDGCKLCQGAIMTSGLTSYNNLYNDFLKIELRENKENKTMGNTNIDTTYLSNKSAVKSDLDSLHETINDETDSKIDEVAKLVNDKFDKTIDHFNLIESDLLSVYSDNQKEIRKRIDNNDHQLYKLWIINIISTVAISIGTIASVVLLALQLF